MRSSLRVMMIMHKSCKNGVTLRNVSRSVMEILFNALLGTDGQ